MFNELSNIIKDLGIKKSDIVLMHLDTDFFEPEIALGKTKKQCAESLVAALKSVLGDEGIFITPAFNYNFLKTGKFDLRKTPSQVGYFSNYLLVQKDSVRFGHPAFSFVGMGKNLKEVIGGISNDAMGKGSVFDRMYQLNAKGLYINTPLVTKDYPPSTFIHYIEQKFGVDYRYLKKFVGEVINGDEKYEGEFFYNVRNYDLDIKTDNFKLYQNALGQGIAKTQMLQNKYPVVAMDLKKVADLALEMLQKDPYAMLEKNPYLK